MPSVRTISSPGWSEGPLKTANHSSLSGVRVMVFAADEVTVRARSGRMNFMVGPGAGSFLGMIFRIRRMG